MIRTVLLALLLVPTAAIAQQGADASTPIDVPETRTEASSDLKLDKVVDAEKRAAPLYRSSLFPLPPEKIWAKRVEFPHAAHVDMECSDCHGAIAEATSLAGSYFPETSVCLDCHEEEAVQLEGLAHRKAGPDEIRFSHALHMGKPDVTCQTCHAGVAESASADDDLNPEMAVCSQCHKQQMDRLACSYCHTRLPERPEPSIGEAVHTVGFFAFHGAWATGSIALCSSCHEQTFCADCHAKTTPLKPSVKFPEKVDRNFIHRGDFLGRHALEAAARPASCQTCHGQSFCQDCHRRTGVAAATATRSPHPPGYSFPGGTAFHGRDARLNIQQCASCHDQGAASNCVTCHRVGGIGGNPHPPGWDRRNADELLKNGRACLPCHGGR